MDGIVRHVRPGPRTRARLEVAAVDDQRRRWRDRQRRSRANRATANNGGDRDRDPGHVVGGNDGGDHDGGDPDGDEDGDQIRWGNRRHRTSEWRSAQRIVATLTRLLERIRNPVFRAKVLDRVFTDRRIRPLLPNYYPTPEEARAQRQILRNLKADLLALKIPHSSGMLARKRAILEAVVGELDSDISKFHSILGTRKANLVAAVDRLRSATETTSSRYQVPSRKKREGGVPEEVKAAVLLWWTEETRVSPRRRDVRRKRLGRNLYDTHAAQLLLESQVRPLPFSSICKVVFRRLHFLVSLQRYV